MVCSGLIWLYHFFGFTPCVHLAKSPLKHSKQARETSSQHSQSPCFLTAKWSQALSVWVLHILAVSAWVFSSTAGCVCVNALLCDPAMNWQLIQIVTLPLPHDSWDRLQSTSPSPAGGSGIVWKSNQTLVLSFLIREVRFVSAACRS